MPTTRKSQIRRWNNSGGRYAYPILNRLTSLAVGFAVSIYWMGLNGPGAKGTRYQVMPECESDPECDAFWSWYLGRKQFHRTPKLAALAFVEGFHEWVAQRRSASPGQARRGNGC
jgi:hypothetical protein